MNITINGESIDFRLESERSAGDVVKGLSSWLENSGMLVASLNLNGKPVLLGDSEWRSHLVDSIDSIDVEAVSLREGRVRQFETARDYFLLLKKTVESGDKETLEELTQGFEDLKILLSQLMDEGPNPTIIPKLEELIGKAGEIQDRDALIKESSAMALILDVRCREAASPKKEALSTAKALASLAGSLDDVAVNLQTGKDRQAMDTIIRLTELLQCLMRSFSWMTKKDDIEVIAEELTGILSELEEALKAGDTVLIGDLLEYEIKTRLIDLPTRLNFLGETVS